MWRRRHPQRRDKSWVAMKTRSTFDTSWLAARGPWPMVVYTTRVAYMRMLRTRRSLRSTATATNLRSTPTGRRLPLTSPVSRGPSAVVYHDAPADLCLQFPRSPIDVRRYNRFWIFCSPRPEPATLSFTTTESSGVDTERTERVTVSSLKKKVHNFSAGLFDSDLTLTVATPGQCQWTEVGKQWFRLNFF